jgi:PAS domain S-box-containing protein
VEDALAGLVALAAQSCEAQAAALAVERGGRVLLLASAGSAGNAAVSGPLPRDFFVCEDTHAAGAEVRAAFPGARFVAAAPLGGKIGLAQAALLIFDESKRQLAPAQARALQLLAAQASALLEARRESAGLAALVASSPDLFFTFDLFGSCSYASAKGAAALGLTPEAMEGKTLRELGLPSEVAAHFGRMLERVVRAGAPLHETQVFAVPAGEVRFAGTLTPIKGAGGAVEAVAIAARDVTAQTRAEREARESDLLLRAILEGSGDAIYVKDIAGRYRIINSAGARILGRTPEEIIGRTDAELGPTEQAARIAARDREVMETGELVIEEVDALYSGVRRVLHTAKGPWRDHEGNLRGVFGVSREITERKRMEEALRATGEILQAALQASPLAIGLVDPLLRVQLWNPAAEHVFGWACAEVMGEEPPGVPRAVWEQGLREKSAPGAEVRGRRRDGTLIDLALWTAPLYGQGGEVSGVIGLYADVTERRRGENDRARLLHAEQAARALAESAAQRVERLQEVVAALSATLSPDEVGRIILARTVPAMGASSGVVLEREGAAMTMLAWQGLRPGAVAFIEQFVPGLEAALTSGAPLFAASPAELLRAAPQLAEAIAASTSRAWAAVPLLAEQRPIGILLLRFSEPRQFSPAERDLLVALAQQCALALHRARLFRVAEGAIRAREDLLAIVSHDLRSSLSVVRLAGSLLERQLAPDAPPIARDPVRLVQRTELTMTRLVNDLLDAARIEAEGLPVHLSLQDALAVAREAITAAQPLAAQRGLALHAALPELPAPASLDRERLLQVFNNLIGNALKFTEAGAVTVSAAERDGELVFSVSDTGRGIDPAHLPHLFDRYWRAPRSQGSPGVGLGLFIARGIVLAHGGRISVASEPGRGTTFEFTLRLLQPAP